jgi:hypothetical protein
MTLEQSTFAALAMTGLSPIPNVTMSAMPAIPGTIFLTAGTLLEMIAYGIQIWPNIAEPTAASNRAEPRGSEKIPYRVQGTFNYNTN